MNFVKVLLKFSATIVVCFVLTALMAFPVKWLKTQNYTAHDTPDPIVSHNAQYAWGALFLVVPAGGIVAWAFYASAKKYSESNLNQ